MPSLSHVSFISGLLAGGLLGVAGRAGRFCTLAMLEDAFFASDTRRLKSFALAATVALLLTQSMAVLGLVDLSASIYLTPSIGLGGAIIGGLMFGIGMALVGTCGFGILVRIGTGDLRAIVVSPLSPAAEPISASARSQAWCSGHFWPHCYRAAFVGRRATTHAN